MVHWRLRALGFLFLVGLLLPLSQPASSVEFNWRHNSMIPYNTRNFSRSDNKYSVQWMVDSPLRGDKFPILIYNEIVLNATVKTTWGLKENFTFNPLDFQAWIGKGNVIWVGLPGTSNGTGSIDLFLNNEYQQYDIEWAKFPAISKVPSHIEYSYRWHSAWAGSTLLTVNLWANGTMQVANKITRWGNLKADLHFYNFSFSFTRHNAVEKWAEFWQPIDFSEAHKWESWEYHAPIAVCDGGGFEERGILYWGENSQYNISLNKVLDDDTCSGTRTLLSHPEISHFFDLTLNTTHKIITDHFNQKNTISEYTDYPLPATLLFLMAGVMIKIRRKMEKNY